MGREALRTIQLTGKCYTASVRAGLPPQRLTSCSFCAVWDHSWRSGRWKHLPLEPSAPDRGVWSEPPADKDAEAHWRGRSHSSASSAGVTVSCRQLLTPFVVCRSTAWSSTASAQTCWHQVQQMASCAFGTCQTQPSPPCTQPSRWVQCKLVTLGSVRMKSHGVPQCILLIAHKPPHQPFPSH